MEIASEFTDEVSTALGFYVYRLIDPRSGFTFYVGKGKANRVFQHARGAIAGEPRLKYDRIREIRQAGFEPKIIVHRHGLDEPSAFLVEAVLIDAYPSESGCVTINLYVVGWVRKNRLRLWKGRKYVIGLTAKRIPAVDAMTIQVKAVARTGNARSSRFLKFIRGVGWVFIEGLNSEVDLREFKSRVLEGEVNRD